VDLHTEETIEELHERLAGARFFYFSAHAEMLYTQVSYQAGDCLIFGPESTGLPADLLHSHRDQALRIPMRSTNVRSLNLATAVGIAVYEALRQLL
jgi:tRNA (cytidine/uridine-2'-O-)-methyltransferase